jgi:hypothetical protein
LLSLGTSCCAGTRLLLQKRSLLLGEFLLSLGRPQALRAASLSLTHFHRTSFVVALISATFIEFLLDFVGEIAGTVQSLTVTLDLLHLVIAELISDRMTLLLLRRWLWRVLLLWLFSHTFKDQSMLEDRR